MYETIDSQQEQNKHNDFIRTHKVTPEMLGLQPTTEFERFAQQQIIDEDEDNARRMAEKGAIDILEAGRRFAGEYNGTYDNVYKKENTVRPEFQRLNDNLNERLQKKEIAKLERNKRVNDGSASLLDRFSSALDRWSDSINKEQLSYEQQMYGTPRKYDENYKYKYNQNKTLLHGYVTYDEVDMRKKIGFLEGLSKSGARAVPFIGGWLVGKDQKHFETIADKIKNNQQITEDDYNFFNKYKDDLYEEQMRGYTIGGLIGKEFLPSLIAFGAEMYAGGAALGAAGWTGKGLVFGDLVANNLININKIGKIGESIAKVTGFTAGHIAEAGMSAAMIEALPTSWSTIYATYRERRLNDKMKITDRGTVIFTDAQYKPAIAFGKSLLSCYISYFTEGMGELIGAPFKVAGKGVYGVGAKQFQKVMEHSPTLQNFIKKSAPMLACVHEKLNNLPIKGESIEWLKSKVKFDGFLEEVGEEVLEDLLNLTFGLDGEKPSLENYIKAIKKSPEEWAVLCGAIGLQGGVLSLSGNMLGHVMEKRQCSPEEIIKVLATSTENDRQELIDEAIRRGDIKLAPASEKHVKMANDVQNDFYNKLIGLGMNEQEALSASILMKNFALKRTVSPERFKNWYDKIVVTNKPQSQVGAVMQNALHQSAMYKSPKQNFSDFYNQVFEKEKDAKENNANLKKSYYEYNNNNIYVRVNHDAINHGDDRHQLSAEEWENVLNNLSNIEKVGISKKQYSNDNVALIKINTPTGKYGVTIQFANGSNFIPTVFKSTDKGIDAWIKRGSANSSTSEPLTSRENSHTVAVVSQNPTNIINYVKQKLNPNVNNHEEGIYVNGKFIPKYTEIKILKKKATKAHFEGDYTSPKINKILYFLKDGHTLDETINEFETSEYSKEHITEIYNKFKDGTYKFVEATPEEYKNEKYVSSEYQNAIDYNKSVDEVFNDIHNDYYDKTHSGVKTGNGYSGYSMSNNAVDAYNRGNKPISKWTKKAILDEIKSIGEEYNLKFDFERLKKENISELRETILTKNGYHHTSKYYNTTDFYYIDLEKLYDNDYILGRLNKHDIRYQQENSSVAPGAIEETIQDKFGCSVEELTENIKQDIISTLSDYDVSDSEFSIQDIKLYGSYSKGTNKATSDLDFIVQYDGSMREDSAFNILHDVEHTIEDKDGNKVLIDINPINVNESGTIDEHIAYMNSLDNNNNVYYQSAYHGTPHKFDEFSTEHIGTGEGAQAHGWGLYFAGNKDVSENYRKELARINNLDLFGSVPVDVYYDGKHATEYFTFADFSLALELVGTQDKKAGIDYLKNEINKCQKRIDEFKEDIKQRPMDIPAFKQQIEDEQDYISELNKQIDFINNLDVNKLEVEKRNQGQLFEVDIPENDALLDEDKELIHQPDKVQRVIEKIYADAMKSNNVELTNAIGITGKEIYRGFSKYFGSDKKASEFLNSYGIKGITYDGRQDGRCYVIFDDKAVNVIKTYYQSMLSGIDKDQKVNVLDLTSAFGSDANLSKKDLTNYIKSLIGSNPISTSDKKAIVNFIARSKRVGKKDVLIPSHVSNSSKVETKNKGVRNTVVNNIIDLIKNSVLIDKSENRDKQTKPNVDYYYRCYVPVRVNNDIYTIRITLENNEKDNLFNIVNGNVYDVIIDKKMAYSTSPDITQGNLGKPSSNSNIPQNSKNVTSDQITIEDMLKGVLDAEGNTYYQSDSEDVIREKLSNENIQNKIDELSQRIEKLAEEESELDNTPIIETMLVDIERLENFMAGDNSNLGIIKKIMGVNEENGVDLGQAIGKYKARKEQEIQNYRGYFVESDKVNILGIGQMSDSSTIIHELGHLFLNGMNEFAKYDEVSKRQLDAINNWLGYNGVAYTRAQHEKFAASFEAYLYKGKAPTNTLRTVFEKFKDWIRSVYVHITDIPDAEISDAAQDVFDRIFSGEEYYEKVKAINILTRKINNTRVSTKFTDMEKRHRKAAYEILSVATGYKEAYLKRVLGGKGKEIIKEGIRLKLENTNDKISTKNGYNPEWLEFYSEPQDYEDSTVALKAFDDVTNNTFMNENITQFDCIDNEDIQYERLLREYKRNPQGRDIVLGAYYEWLSNIKDSEVKKFYQEKFENDASYIERFENLDKFNQAKLTILNRARAIKNSNNVSDMENYKNMVKEIMNGLNFLSPDDKAKMTVNILDCSSLGFLEAGIDSILDIAKTLDDRAYRKKLMSLIKKELDGTKNVKQGSKTVGKYDYLSNKVFEQLREIDKWTVEKANEKRLEIDISQDEEQGLTFEERLIREYINYKANGNTYGTTENVKAIYDDICKMKKLAKSVKSESELFEKLNNQHLTDELVAILRDKKIAKNITKLYNNLQANWESCLNLIFNKSIKDKYSMLLAETDSDVWIYKAKRKFEQAVANIYGLRDFNFDDKIIENLATKDTFREMTNRRYDAEGKLEKCEFVEVELNKMQMLQAWIFSHNEVMNKRLINQFGENELERMFNYLTNEDERLGILMMNMCSEFYPEVNKVFIAKYGLDLPKVQSYFPSTPRHESEVDFLTDFAMKSSSPSMIKTRSAGERISMKLNNPVQVFYNHIDKCGRFIHLTNRVDKINKVFLNEAVEKLIINKYGEEAFKTLKQQIFNMTFKSNDKVYNGLEELLNGITSNWIQSNVAVRSIVGLKQLLSASNYATDMPFDIWAKGFIKSVTNYKSTIDYMMKIPYLDARFNGSMQNEFLKQTIENSKWAKTKKFKELLSLNIRLGDIGAIIFGGKPYIDYLIKEKGMTEKEAIDEFILSTQRSQQSSATTSLANWQIAWGKNPLLKLFSAYKNSPAQYMRLASDAIISVANGDMTKKQCAKVLFNYVFFQPLLYTLATTGSIVHFATTGDGNDVLKDIVKSIFDLNASAIALLGDVYKTAVALFMKMVTGDKVTLPNTIPLLSDLLKDMKALYKDDAGFEDYFEFASFVLGRLGTGIPIDSMVEQVSSIGDFAQGDFVKGTAKALGYTDYRAGYMAGEDK